jgi:hypothetical protein
MAKKAATFRLEESSLAWLSSYAEERSKSEGRKVGQGEVVEAALASFRQDCEGGVPDLPEPSTVTEVVEQEKAEEQIAARLTPKPTPVKQQVHVPSLLGQRQQRLNEMIDRARGTR